MVRMFSIDFEALKDKIFKPFWENLKIWKLLKKY